MCGMSQEKGRDERMPFLTDQEVLTLYHVGERWLPWWCRWLRRSFTGALGCGAVAINWRHEISDIFHAWFTK